MEKIDKTLTKYNKLKLFGEHVSAHMREVVDVEGLRRIDVDVARTDCLYNGDIYTTRDLYEKLDAIAACASILELRQYDTGEIKIHNANYCHNPVVCPICSDRVSKRRRALFTEPLKRAVRKFGVQRATGDWKSEYPDAYTGVYMATATIKDGNNLKERIDTLLDAVKRMRKMGQKRQGGRSQGEWSKVRAGLSNVEIKIGTGSGKWHVHAHFLLFTDSPINIRTTDSEYFIKKETEDLNLFEDKVQISKFNHEWYTATHGQGINFDVRPIEFKRDVNGRKCETFAESVDAQAQEVLKYSTLLSTKKGTGVLSSAQYVELIQRRGTRRLFNAIGLLRCDKRNPDSFMTITERELRRLEYVDQMDSKYYEIYASQWQHGESYGKTFKQDRAVFSTSDDMKTKFVNIRRRSFMAQTAIYQGEYRKQRNNFFKSRHMYSDKNVFEGILNDCRDIFRNKVAALWQKLSDNDFIPDFLTEWDSTGLPGFKQKHLRFAS